MVGRLSALGIASPLPIQAACIPDILNGRDVCGQAPTGSGKTLAYALPLVASPSEAALGRPGALVLVPTRELADQVSGVLARLMGRRSNRVVALYGGTGYGAQRQALRRGADIVVGCPGRIEDLVARDDLDLSAVGTVVLDEADRMVDMGFVRPVCRLLDQTAPGRQVLLFSATMGTEVEAISRRYQREPLRYRVQAEATPQGEVAHHFWAVGRADRVKVTAELIARHGQAFVFCRTKHGADRVARQLKAAGVAAAAIHGDRSQPERKRALAGFATRATDALVATDVVARGIHVEGVPCVVHFDPANDADSYVHRSGRTGRAGADGIVVSLVSDEVLGDVRALQRALGFRDELTAPFAGATGVGRSEPLGPAESKVSGTVTFFDQRRGFGFLSAPDGTNVYVHHSKLHRRPNGQRALRKGDRVVFELAEGRRGPEARNVTVADGVAS